MKTTKILLFFAFHFSLFTLCSAQTDADKKAMCNSYLRAKYIFEGKVDSSKYFTVQTGEHTYANFNSYLVEVQKVIKGNIQKGTIEILEIADGTIYNDGNITKSGQTIDGNPPPPGQGLYLCWDTTGFGKASYFTNSNAKTLRSWDGVPVTNGKIKKAIRGHDLSDYFSTLSEFYDYISVNYGIKIDSAK